MSLTVELDVLSGRPNPTWQLSEEQERDLRALLAKNTSASDRPPPPLGYRGFVIGTPPKIRIFADAALERWLLTSAPPTLEAPLRDLVLQALGEALDAP